MDTILSKKGTVARITCRRRQLPALGRGPLPAQQELRQSDHHRQAAAIAVAQRRRRTRTLRAGRLGLGVGQHRSRASAGRCVGERWGFATWKPFAAAAWLREKAPGLRVRVVNVVDLMALFPPGAHLTG